MTGKTHPTQKPVALFEYLIRTYTNEGETVLDNTAGVFTTAIACLNTNRNYIVMEKEQEYFDKGMKRIQEWHERRNNIQPNLFSL
jgi:site-specific DNA-methyltransferase (adenine-specific)